MDPNQYDPHAKEAQLRAESEAWDTSRIIPAQVGDIPVIDAAPYFRTGGGRKLEELAAQLLHASTKVGFLLSDRTRHPR